MVKIAILDDTELYIEKIKTLLEKNLEVAYRVYEYSTSDSFIKQLHKQSFDIVFLDIMLDKRDGIEVGKIVNAQNSSTNIIFVSENEEFFRAVYKVTHSYFLTKDFDEELFVDAIDKAVKSIKRDVITIHTKNGYEKFTVSKIVYCEGTRKKTKIVMLDGNSAEHYVSLVDIEDQLPEQTFLKCHKSFVVNMNYITRYDRKSIFMENEIVVPISKTYIKTVRETLTRFLGGIL